MTSRLNSHVSNVFGSYNRGDALLVEALHHSIRSAYGMDAELYGIAHFPDLERAHLPDVTWSNPPARSYSDAKWLRRGTNAIRTIGSLAYAGSNSPKYWPFLTPPRSQRDSIGVLQRADLVVSCAGGFLLDNNPSIFGNLMQMEIANRAGTPLVLAPQTIGPIRNERIRDIQSY